MKKIGWMWLAGLAFASSVQAQKIEEHHGRIHHA